jgi:LmbE family N-acetylglucosaminyl deacetylase
MIKKILAVGAHPDDMELESGGTLAKFALKGSEVYHLILTSGYKDSVSISVKQRKDEAECVASILGIKEVIFFDYQDTELTTNGKVISQVDEIIDEIKPDVCISHHPFDSHQDHKATAEIMFAVSRQGRVKNLLSGSPLPYRPNIFAFRPQLFVDITETLEIKLNALRAYKSQYEKFGGERLIEQVNAMAQNYGWAMGHKYAECFEVIRMDDSLW